MTVKNKTNETGRSMVEMLGVLAIIGVLSVAGVAGYKAAVRKSLANNLLNQASMRATDVATKIGSGNLDALDSDSFAGNLGGGVTMSSAVKGPDGYTDYNESDEQFTLTMEGVDEEMCQQMQSMAGGSRSVVRAVLCDGDKAILTFNKDLSANSVSSDFDGNKEGCESSGRKYCANDTCIPATEECPTGESLDTVDPLCKDVKCESGQECVGGACVTVTPNSSNGCSNNSDCNTWCETNSYDKCYCEISSSPNWNDSNCYTSFTGTCAAVYTKSGISGGYVVSDGGMSWWSAVNFCKATKTGGKLVSLSDMGITGGYEDDGCSRSSCTGANWSDLQSKLKYDNYWVTDAVSCTDPENRDGCTSGSNNNSCGAFYVNTTPLSSGVASTYRFNGRFALCE